MSQIQFIDTNGLAGYMSLGFVQNNMEMVLRTGTLDFGNKVAENNRHLLGDSWESNFTNDAYDWPVKKVEVVLGCPPCSGWSVWSGPANRGPDSKAHEHTSQFMTYAGRVKPKVVVFECVQQAFTQGRSAMLAYRDILETVSKKKYDLYHVKHNNLQLGGFSYRPRYFWVAVQKGMQFSVPRTEVDKIPTIEDVIGDLAKMPQTWEKQKYVEPMSKYVKHLRARSGKVDGHIGKTNIHAQRVAEIFDTIGNAGWVPGGNMGEALRLAVEMRSGNFPDTWLNISAGIAESDFNLGFSQPYRWKPNSWCNVLTGSCLDHVVHPTEPRLITHRESARIQGLPDSWDIEASKGYSPLAATWGKAVAVQPSAWIASAVKNSIEGGEPMSEIPAEKIGDREYLIDADKGFSRHYARRKYFNEEPSKKKKKNG